MEEKSNLDALKARKTELEITLVHLAELFNSRNKVLSYLEKVFVRKTLKFKFSYLNINLRGELSGMELIKRNYELDIKLFRRGQFYLQKRKRRLIEEIESIVQQIGRVEEVKQEVSHPADTTNPLQSA